MLANITNNGKGNYPIGWSAVTGATEYVLQEDEAADFASPIDLYPGHGTSAVISGKGGGIYYYRVRAVNAFGSSGWSQTQSVTVHIPATCPQSGNWSGTTNQDSAISFIVTHTPGCQLSYLEITVFCGTTHTSSWTGTWEITDSSFRVPGTLEATGVFASRTSASGRWSYWDLGCRNSGTWTAKPEPLQQLDPGDERRADR